MVLSERCKDNMFFWLYAAAVCLIIGTLFAGIGGIIEYNCGDLGFEDNFIEENPDWAVDIEGEGGLSEWMDKNWLPEEPELDVNGNPVKDADGNIKMVTLENRLSEGAMYNNEMQDYKDNLSRFEKVKKAMTGDWAKGGIALGVVTGFLVTLPAYYENNPLYKFFRWLYRGCVWLCTSGQGKDHTAAPVSKSEPITARDWVKIKKCRWAFGFIGTVALILTVLVYMGAISMGAALGGVAGTGALTIIVTLVAVWGALQRRRLSSISTSNLDRFTIVIPVFMCALCLLWACRSQKSTTKVEKLEIVVHRAEN